MRKLMKLAVTMMFVLTLAACGKPTLDTSSDEAMEKSAKKIMAELSSEDQVKFQETLAGLYMLGALASFSGEQSPDEIKSALNAKLHGKTADEIFELGEEMRQQLNGE